MALLDEQVYVFNYFKMVHVSFVEDTIKAYREILTALGKPCDDVEIDDVLNKINNTLKKYDLEIVEGTDNETSRKVHCLITTAGSPLMQKSSIYDKSTCELLSKIIQSCLNSQNLSISEISCLNLDVTHKSNKTNLQSSLNTLITDKWIVSKNGVVTIGIRSQLEFEPIFKKQWGNDIAYCPLCKSLTLDGIKCDSCKNVTHVNCLKKYYEVFNILKGQEICLVCKVHIGENLPSQEDNTSLAESETEECALSTSTNFSSQNLLSPEIDTSFGESSTSDPPSKKLCRSMNKKNVKSKTR